MKKLVSILISVIVFYLFFIVLIKSTNFKGEQVYVQYNNEGLSQFADSLVAKKIIFEKTSFLLIAKVFKVEDKIRPGKFLVKRKTNLIDIIRMLRNNRQATVKLVLNKVRTKGEFAKLIATAFDKDSAEVMTFLSSNDSLKAFGTDTTQLFTLLIPNTYEFYWSSSMAKILGKLQKEQIYFWSQNNRIQKAASKGLRQDQIYTLASIVEEETNYDSDKSLIASVYQNRLVKQMPLQACPTIKYAMQDFTITRIYEKYLSNTSPYNTYRIKGLPPGPICTPSIKTIDAVLNTQKTDFLFFCAKSDFSGYHSFASTAAEHYKNAHAYQKALDKLNIK